MPPASLYEPFRFNTDTKVDIDGTKQLVAELKSLAVSLRHDVVPSTDGKDTASHSGYDPEERGQIRGLSRKYQVLKGTIAAFEEDTKVAITAYNQLNAVTDPPPNVALNRETRKEVAKAVLAFLTDDPANFGTLLSGLGIDTSAEFDNALQEVLGRLSDSQTDRLIGGTSHSEELVALRHEAETGHDELKKAEATAEALQRTLTAKEAECNDWQEKHSAKAKEASDESRAATWAKSQLRKAFATIADLEVQRESQRQRISSERDAFDAEISQLRRQLSEREQARMELENERNNLLSQTSKLQSELKDARVHLLNHESLEKSRDQMREELQKRDKAAQSQFRKLKKKDQQIQTKDKRIQSQAENASLLLKHLSLGVDYQGWDIMIQKVLADSEVARPRIHYKPWDIASCSIGAPLTSRHHVQSVNMIAIDVLAILNAKTASTEHLLSHLEALKEGLQRSMQIVKSIFYLLIDSFINAASDQRLHVMHLIAMSQIIQLLVPEQGRTLFTQAVDNANALVGQLVQALFAYDQDPSSEFTLAESIAYLELILIGLRRNTDDSTRI
ncbi:hypothetical protein FSHL1_010442 [Fusarium sambucinum]